jgi:hypothetical protein
MTPFDYVKSATETKQYLTDLTDYAPFVVNKAMSNFPDGIFHANEINKAHFLDKKLQYDYYFYVLAKKKRWAPWNKRPPFDDVRAVSEYYKYSHEKARLALSLLTDDQLAQIKEIIKQGGVTKKDEYS